MNEPGTTETTSAEENPNDYQNWVQEIQASEKELRTFWQQGRRVVKRYMDQQDSATIALSSVQNVDKYNVFWANVGVLKASLYSNPPRPFVKREFDDFQDDAARVAGIMMERLLKQGFEGPEDESYTAFKQVVEDRLVPGIGQVWLRYVPTTEEVELAPSVRAEMITDERVATDYVYWEDFLWSPARTWAEVRWVGKRIWLTKKEFKERFPKIPVQDMSWTRKYPIRQGDRVAPEDIGIKKTEVFEIWCQTSRSVIWFSKSYEQLLDVKEDPLKITGFFPCPKPLLATHTTSSMTPKADYLMVQSQYRRLDNLAFRIGLLEDAIQASGVYDKSAGELSQILTGNTNKLIPVDNWAMFAEKGGLKGTMDWFPLDMVVTALDKLRSLFADAKGELYELTGISDIMRGVSAPRETATAQGLKAQYSSVRLQYLQEEVAEFIQGALRIKSEIISKHFQPETIIRNSLIEYTPDGDLAVDAVQVLKDEWSKAYRISVYADQLAIPDYNAERQGRIEFIGAMGQFISQVYPLLESEPGAGPFLMQILQWGIASFRSAHSIEGVFDKAALAITNKLQQAQNAPPQPSPEEIKAQTQAKAAEHKLSIDQQKAQLDAQQSAQKTQAEIQQTAQKTQAEIQAMWAKTNAEIQASKVRTSAQVRETTIKNRASIAQAKAKAKAQPKAKQS